MKITSRVSDDMKKQGKEEWIHEIMGSLDGLEKPEPNASVYNKMEKRLNTGKVLRLSNQSFIPLRQVGIAAAILVMLATANFYMLNHVSKPGAGQDNISKLATYYQLTDNNPLYHL